MTDIQFELPVKLTKIINEELANDGLELSFVRQEGQGLYLLKVVEKQHDGSPPALGIHIRDGMGTKDKVGG